MKHKPKHNHPWQIAAGQAASRSRAKKLHEERGKRNARRKAAGIPLGLPKLKSGKPWREQV